MSKNLVVGGTTHNGIRTINVATSDGGTSTWIPKDEISDHANLTTLAASHNGTYRPRGNVDGYDEVFVNVEPTLVPLTVTRNGIYKPIVVVHNNGLGSGTISFPGYDGYSEVRVNVPNGGTAQTLVAKGISQNGIYNASDDAANGYLSVSVNVPNTYAQSDEGKVVSSGALVSQSSMTIDENGQYATTTNNSVTVNVPNTYTQADEGKVVDDGALVGQTALTINTNGEYDTTTNNSVTVDIATSITAEDNGKVVVNGGLESQTSLSINQNGTYDTTANNQVVVGVPGGYSKIEMTSIVGVYVYQGGETGWAVYPDTDQAENAETFYADIPSAYQNGGYILLSTERQAGATYSFTRNRVAFTTGTENPFALPNGQTQGSTTPPEYFLNALSANSDKQFTFLKVPNGMTRVYWTTTQASYRLPGQKCYMYCLFDESLQSALFFEWDSYINIRDKKVSIDTTRAT